MNFIGRCDPVPFDSDELDLWTEPDCWFRFPVSDRHDGTQAFFDLCVPGENDSLSLTETEAYRLLCHVLVQHLPDTAFDETVEALTGMYEFYQDSPALPAPSQSQSVKAKVTGSYTAPVYPIMEE